MAIVRGDWLQALAAHLFGPVLFASFLIAIVHIASELLTGRRITAFYIQLLRRRALQVNILFIVLSYYALRLYYLSMSGELTLAFLNSPFGHLLFSGTNAS